MAHTLKSLSLIFKTITLLFFGLVVPIVLLSAYLEQPTNEFYPNNITLLKVYRHRDNDKGFQANLLYPQYSSGFNITMTLYKYLNLVDYKCTLLPYDDLTNPGENINLILNNVIFIVLSAPNNFDQRLSIRKTWGFKQHVYFFTSFINTTKDTALKLYKESQDNNDIVFLNLYDTYDNLTLKVHTTIKWISTYCHDKNTLIVKVDDNVFFNVNLLSSLTEYFLTNNKYIYGRLFTMAKPKSSGKYMITKKEYPFRYYPPFVSGSCYIMKKDDFINLVNSSNNLKYFKLEDVFFTGIAARIFNYKHFHVPNILSLYNNITTASQMKSILSVHRISISEMYQLYKLV